MKPINAKLTQRKPHLNTKQRGFSLKLRKPSEIKRFISRNMLKNPSSLVAKISILAKNKPEQLRLFLKEENGVDWIDSCIQSTQIQKVTLALSALKLYFNSCDI